MPVDEDRRRKAVRARVLRQAEAAINRASGSSKVSVDYVISLLGKEGAFSSTGSQATGAGRRTDPSALLRRLPQVSLPSDSGNPQGAAREAADRVHWEGSRANPGGHGSAEHMEHAGLASS